MLPLPSRKLAPPLAPPSRNEAVPLLPSELLMASPFCILPSRCSVVPASFPLMKRRAQSISAW
ncbi:MAG TPA: hypothetical protein DD401_01875 [Prevotella sp.]|nr:hypothetical protein [Prevotella sp.]